MRGTPLGTGERTSGHHGWLTLSVTSVGVLLTTLNTGTLDVALPTVARHFNASASAASWILLSYLLTLTTFILIFGRMADLFGRKRLYLIGLSAFTLTSFACGLAPDVWILVALRAVQGCGAAAIVTNTTALIIDAFPKKLVGAALGFNITVIAASQVAAPLVGGIVTTNFGWRWVFWFNAPVGIFGLVWAVLTLRSLVPKRRERFDGHGAVLSALALAAFVLALNVGGNRSWTSPFVLAMALTFVLLAGWFARTQLHREHPLIDPKILASRARRAAYLVMFLMSMSRISVVLLISLYVQATSHRDALSAGLRIAPFAVGIMVAAPFSGYLLRRYAPSILVAGGLAAGLAPFGYVGFALRPDIPTWHVTVALFIIGIGTGVALTPNTSVILADVQSERRGAANGLRSMLQNAGALSGTALSLALITFSLHGEQKAEVYAGDVSRFQPDELAALTNGYHWAFFALCAANGLAIALAFVGRASVVRVVRDPAVVGADVP